MQVACVLHCFATHGDIREGKCSSGCCTAHAGQINMMEDLYDGYHSNTRLTVAYLIANARPCACGAAPNGGTMDLFFYFLGQTIQGEEKCDTLKGEV